MKKLFLLLIVGLLAVLPASADKYMHSDEALPQAAKAVLKKNFKSEVSLVKIEKEFAQIKEYEVIMTDGTEITFDRQGNWKEVETRNTGSIPVGFVPAGIQKYVKANHKDTRIVGIEKSRSGYEIDLSNGIEMKFNSDGDFLRYD